MGLDGETRMKNPTFEKMVLFSKVLEEKLKVRSKIRSQSECEAYERARNNGEAAAQRGKNLLPREKCPINHPCKKSALIKFEEFLGENPG